MPIATLTSKGQVTIPQSVREQLSLRTGTRLEFSVASDGTMRVSPKTKTVAEVAGMLHRPGMKPSSIAEMDRSVARHFRNSWR